MKIEAKGVRKSYFLDDSPIEVLCGVDLCIESGELVALTGPSGVGKSTFLHLLGTLDEPSGGSILFDGEDIFLRTPAQIAEFRNRHVGFVFQFHHLLPEFSALENVMMPNLINRVPASEAEKKAKEWLSEVGLSHRMGHRPGELSGGEQQRVALARALVNSPRLVLADEPTGNLDEKTGQGIHDVIARLSEERGMTVVVVTHNPRLAASMPRQIAFGPGGEYRARASSAAPVVVP